MKKLYLLLIALILMCVPVVKAQDITKIGYSDSTSVSNWTEIKIHGGELAVTSTPYLQRIAEGNITGHFPIFVSGSNDAVGANFETVSEIQGLITYLSSAEILKVSSASANDAAAGTGARTLEIIGADNSGDLITDTITLNGLTAVDTNLSFLRVNSVKVLTAGTLTTNAGIISVKNNAETATIAKMMASEGRNSDATFFVPNGYTALITGISGSAIGAQNSVLYLMCRPWGGAFTYRYKIALKDSATPVPFDTGIVCPAKTDIALWAYGSATPAFVVGHFEGRYEAE